MAKEEIFRCDNCKVIKKESNNWARLWYYDFGLLLTKPEAEPPNMPGHRLKHGKDTCGVGCPHELLGKSLDEPETVDALIGAAKR